MKILNSDWFYILLDDILRLTALPNIPIIRRDDKKMVVENIKTVLKDIKVTKKGINITLENAKLQGEQLQELAALIGEAIVLAVNVPQLNIFDEEVSNAEIEQELGLS